MLGPPAISCVQRATEPPPAVDEFAIEVDPRISAMPNASPPKRAACGGWLTALIIYQSSGYHAGRPANTAGLADGISVNIRPDSLYSLTRPAKFLRARGERSRMLSRLVDRLCQPERRLSCPAIRKVSRSSLIASFVIRRPVRVRCLQQNVDEVVARRLGAATLHHDRCQTVDAAL
jgi:hypothetical protein